MEKTKTIAALETDFADLINKMDEAAENGDVAALTTYREELRQTERKLKSLQN